MKEKPLERKNYMWRRVLLFFLAILIVFVGTAAIINKNTLFRIFNPETITILSYPSVRERLADGESDGLLYGITAGGTDDGIRSVSYTAHYDSMVFDASFDGNELVSLKAVINPNDVRISGIGDAAALGDSLLEPYFEKNDRAALIFLIMTKLLPHAGNAGLQVDFMIGNISVEVIGDSARGTVSVDVTNKK